MRIAYLTTDEVNREWAKRLADESGATLYDLTPVDGPPDSQYEALIFDLDYLPPEQRREILAGLLVHPANRPTALHSHNLDDEVVVQLRQNGVIVARRLAPMIFQTLARANRDELRKRDACHF
jgi:hypothetical protein